MSVYLVTGGAGFTPLLLWDFGMMDSNSKFFNFATEGD